MSIKSKVAGKISSLFKSKPDITKGVYANMTHISENVKKPSFDSVIKAKDQQRKNNSRPGRVTNIPGKNSNGVGVGF